jgi:hypothetical protein
MWGKLTMNDEEEEARFHAPDGLIYTGVEFCAIMKATQIK